MKFKSTFWILALVLCVALALPALTWAEDDTRAGAYKDRHFEETWDDASATHIVFDQTGAIVTGNGASAEGATVTVSQAGTYVFSGACDDGQIRVEATKDDKVVLVLNGLTLACSNSSPLYVLQADEARILLAEGSENRLSDAAEYVWAEGEDEPDAAIFSKDDLAISGSGTLEAIGNLRNGIATKNDLVVTGGNIAIKAVNDGLRGKDSVSIAGGNLTITAGNDGIKSNDATDETTGWIAIDGGNFTIVSGFDAIQAESTLTVTGGTFDLTTGGGSAAAPQRAENFGGGRGFFGGTTTIADTESESDSKKGLKATTLSIQGGTFTMDTEDDALHANGDASVSGGIFTIRTGDDGIHADSALLITGGTLEVLQSYEGLEGATVDIRGGDIRVTASDDGINAAGGSDGQAAGPFGQDFFRAGGGNNSAYSIVISGGSVYVNADGDGVDSNGSLTISGGAVVVHGPINSANSALDSDGTLAIGGGTVIASGSMATDGMSTPSSTQVNLTVGYNQSLPAGTTVTLRNAAGETLASVVTEKQVQSVLFSMPELANGETYTVETSTGITTQATISAVSTAVAQDGSASAGNGMFGPGRGGQGGMGGFGGRQGGTPGEGGNLPAAPDTTSGATLPADPNGENALPPAQGGTGV